MDPGAGERAGDRGAGVVVEQVQGDDGDIRRRLSWTAADGSRRKIPPFEALLTNFKPTDSENIDDGLFSNEDTDNEGVLEEGGVALTDFEAMMAEQTRNRRRRPKAGSRTPLPLLEDEAGLVEDAKDSRSLKRPKRSVQTVKAYVSSKDQSSKSWKTRRRLNF